MSGPALFIAGTDTGVGKTTVAVALCEHLRARGLRVGVFKPAETGCADPSAPADALALAHAAASELPVESICPYRFHEPLAPAVAAERAGISIDLDLLKQRLHSLRANHDVVLVEGAGGLLVPFAEGTLTIDWVVEMALPVVLVARLGLGTLNHTLLSARLLADRGVVLLATVLSETDPDDSAAAATNEDVLRRYGVVRMAGTLRHQGQSRNAALPPALLTRIDNTLTRTDVR